MVDTGITVTDGHLGDTRTRSQLRCHAFWSGWSKYVERFLKACVQCPRYKRGKAPRQEELCPILTGSPFEVLSLDVTGPHPKSSNGYTYILTVMDNFSKFEFAIPIRDQEASTISTVLMKQVFFFGWGSTKDTHYYICIVKTCRGPPGPLRFLQS